MNSTCTDIYLHAPHTSPRNTMITGSSLCVRQFIVCPYR